MSKKQKQKQTRTTSSHLSYLISYILIDLQYQRDDEKGFKNAWLIY